jgi:glycosyltransferase involved in cell wall biosynthesis
VKIIYFTLDYSVHDHRFLSALAKGKNEVYLLRLEPSHSLKDSLPDRVKEIAWRPRGKRARWFAYSSYSNALQHIIDEYHPDVIHAGPIQRVAYIAARSGFHPLISMSWGSDLLIEADRNGFLKSITRTTLKRSDILITDCKAVTEKAKQFGFSKKRIIQFPWGVDLKLFSPGPGTKTRKELGWDENFIIFSNRSWEPVYGVDDVVRAFILAFKKNNRIRLILAGTGSQKTFIHNLLTEQGICDQVYFPGRVHQRDLPKLYRAADVYVSASHTDGSSVSLMEAMACGRPVLVSDIPGNREWIMPGENGWLFSDGSIDELAAMLLQVPADAKLKRIGSVNRALAEKKANWKKNSQLLINTYRVIGDGIKVKVRDKRRI